MPTKLQGLKTTLNNYYEYYNQIRNCSRIATIKNTEDKQITEYITNEFTNFILNRVLNKISSLTNQIEKLEKEEPT